MLTGLVLFVCMLVKVAGGPVALVNAAVGLPLLVPTALLHFRALGQRVAQRLSCGNSRGDPRAGLFDAFALEAARIG